MTWHTQRMTAWDLETTAPDPETARIVTACVVQVGGGQPVQSATWIADPGVEIPAEAAEIHGYTTERARKEGVPAAEVIEQVIAALVQALAAGTPLIAMNARYDFTVLDREARRHGLTPLTDIVNASELLVIDPFVIDKAVDQYRRGKRTLAALCEHYRVALDGAHDSAADAIAAARVAWRLGSDHPHIGGATLPDLHQSQVRWAADQADSLREYFARTPDKRHLAKGVRTEWPLIPHQDGAR